MSEAQTIELLDHILHWAKIYSELKLPMIAVYGLTSEGNCQCIKGSDCNSAGKHPISKNWPKEATTDYEIIKRQLAGGRNIGIVTGNGLDVIDLDGPTGIISFTTLAAEHDVPSCPIAESGSGGKHFFFKTAVSLPNRVKFMPGLDNRGENGFVVVCP